MTDGLTRRFATTKTLSICTEAILFLDVFKEFVLVVFVYVAFVRVVAVVL